MPTATRSSSSAAGTLPITVAVFILAAKPLYAPSTADATMV